MCLFRTVRRNRSSIDSMSASQKASVNAMNAYLLSQDAFVCFIDNIGIILDLRSGNYLSLPTEVLTIDIHQDLTASLPEDDPRRQLISRGLLTLDPSTGKPIAPITVSRAKECLADLPIKSQSRTRLSSAFNFISAFTRASLSLRYRSMRDIVQQLKAIGSNANPDRDAMDLQTLRSLMGSFFRMSPFFYARKNGCLIDCITGFHYLCRYGVRPSLVFGVQAAPFNAHCWLQWNGILLNDVPLHVARFTPIMAI